MRLKNVMAFIVAGTMVIGSLAGCGSSAGGSDTDSVQKSKVDEAEIKNAEATALEDITITMLYSGTASENDFDTMILPGLVKEAFPNITLEVTKLPDDQYYTALKTKLASGECPDIILVQPMYAGANSVINLAKAGYLEPLSDLKSMEKMGSSVDAFTYNDEVYGMPTGVSILGTYANMDMFLANDLEIPTNWEEFLNCCEVLKNAGIQPIVMGDKDMYVLQFGLYQIAANIVYPNNEQYDSQLRTKETAFTDEGTWDKVLEMYGTLYERGYVDANSLGLSAQQAIQKFIDGEAAMTFDGSFNLPALSAEGAGGAFQRGYFPLPGNAKGQETYGAVAPGAGPAIFSGSKYVEQCKAILDMYYDGESDMWKARVAEGKFIPTYGHGMDEINALYQPFIELSQNGKAFYWCNQAWPAGVESEMQALFSEMIGGQGIDVAEITKGMQMKFEELYTGD